MHLFATRRRPAPPRSLRAIERSQERRSRSLLAEPATTLRYSRVPAKTGVAHGDGRFGNLTAGSSSGSGRPAAWLRPARTGCKGVLRWRPAAWLRGLHRGANDRPVRAKHTAV